MKVYIGLDVHSKKTVFVAQDHEGKVIGKGSVPTSEEGLVHLLDQVGSDGETVVGLETGQQSTWVSCTLADLGVQAVVIDAREVRVKARRIGQKTDMRDAFEICDGLRRDQYVSRVWIPPAGIQRLRRIVSRRRHFVGLCTSQVNGAKYILRSAGLDMKKRSLDRAVGWDRLLSDDQIPSELRQHIAMHRAVWETCRAQVEALEQDLEDALVPYDREASLLRSIPGVGLITTVTFLAVVGTPSRFANSGRVGSYLGLIPSMYDSGDRERHGHITKRGSSDLRSLLCEVAHHAGSPRHPLYPYFIRDMTRSGYKKAVVSVAHRMARIMYQVWKTGEPFDDRKLRVLREPDKRRGRPSHRYRFRPADTMNVTA